MEHTFRLSLICVTALLPAVLPAAPPDCTGISPAGSTTMTSIPVATGLTGRPLYVTSPPGDPDRIFIVEQSGRIWHHRRGTPATQRTEFLDLTGVVQAAPSLNEMGLLGLAFDPDYASNGLFYVNYTEGNLGGPWFTVVAHYSVDPTDPNIADPGSEVRLLRFQQPQSNHNGGQLLFGDDGFLYVWTGDGGGSFDQGTGHATCGNGQSRATLLGKILRLDVRNVDPTSLPPDCGGVTAGYRVPSDNPFAGGLGGDCDEIWAYGLRNPWRSAFDPLNGDLYVADVGQRCWEEVNYVPAASAAGRNYGWRPMEGTHCVSAADPNNCDPAGVSCGTSPPCNDPSLTIPVVQYGHSGMGSGCSITGGFVYRGCKMPAFSGTYFYGDFCAGFVNSFRISGGAVTDHVPRTAELGLGTTLLNSLTSFGTDDRGEIYVVDRDGTIRKIVPPFPDLEVSGPGSAAPLTLGAAAWTWEDLPSVTDHPVASYRVYRGAPGGSFQCVLATPATQWPSGDPAIPAAGGLFAYLVTAVNGTGQQTLSGSPASTLLGNPCP